MPEHIPLWAHVLALTSLLLISGFFSIAETAMMAISRIRLQHLVRQGNVLARHTEALLGRTDRLLSVVLIGNNLANTAATTLVTAIAIYDFGLREWQLGAATVVIAFVILVFSEITPKIIGATYPEPIALALSVVLRPILQIATPAVWFVNLFVQAILRLLHITGAREERATVRLSPEELRSVVLEGSSFIPQQHRSMLLNVFDLESLTVDDIMTPRANIDGLDLDRPVGELLEQIKTSYHGELPAYDGDVSRTQGILSLRRLLPVLAAGAGADTLTRDQLRSLLIDPYWIPTGTSLLQQLQMFQDNRQHLGLVVDEYGDLLGLVTVDDIVEEIIGEIAPPHPGLTSSAIRWSPAGDAVVDGSISLRLLNRRLGIALPLAGPKTLNGLLLEILEQIPDAPCCVRLPGCAAEILQTYDQAVRGVRLIRVPAMPSSTETR